MHRGKHSLQIYSIFVLLVQTLISRRCFPHACYFGELHKIYSNFFLVNVGVIRFSFLGVNVSSKHGSCGKRDFEYRNAIVCIYLEIMRQGQLLNQIRYVLLNGIRVHY